MNRNNWISNAALGAVLCLAGRALGQAPSAGQAHPPAAPVTKRTYQFINRRPVILTPAQKAMEHEKYRLDAAAAAALDAGQYAEAEDDAQQSMALGQNSGLAQEIFAAALDAEGKTQEALRAYQQMSDAGEVYPRTQLPYALLLLKTGHWAQAVTAYNKQLPYLADGKLMNASSHFSPAVPQPKELETAIHIGLGLTYNYEATWGGQSQVNKALSEHKKAVTLEPASPLANLYYGYALQRLGRKAEAQAAFAKAAKTGSADVKAAAEEEIKR